MKKRILSVVSAVMVVCIMFCSSVTNVRAAEMTNKKVDGSYLTQEESSTGKTKYDLLVRGEHLMDGTVTISKSGVKKVFVYGSTTANHTVDKLVVIMYVEEYNPETEYWEQVDTWITEAENDYYVVTQKMMEVDGGHYYRARCEHFAGNEEDTLYDSSVTVTDGIWVD